MYTSLLILGKIYKKKITLKLPRIKPHIQHREKKGYRYLALSLSTKLTKTNFIFPGSKGETQKKSPL